MISVTRRVAAPLALAALLAGCGSKESKPVPPPAISLSATALTFASTMAGAAAPAAQTITIGNSGGGALATPFVSVDFGGGPTGWIATAISGTEAPFTLTVTPSSAVAAGPHTATIQVASAGASNTPASVTVQFTVTANTEPVIALTDSALQFTAQIGTADPAAQTLTVSNGGGGVLADPTVTIDYGAGAGGWLTAVAAGVDVTVTASLVGALPRGRFYATLSIASAGAYNTPVLVPVVFDVTEPELAVSPQTLSFSMREGTLPAAKRLTVSNAADGSLDPPTVTVSGGSSFWLSATVSGASAPYTVTVTVEGFAGFMAPGTYSGTLTIDSPNASNGPITVPVTLTITASPPATVSCYVAAQWMCVELTSSNSTFLDSYRSQCLAIGGSTAPCPTASRFGPCALGGGTFSEAAWFYPPYTNDSAAFYCTITQEGTWDGTPVAGGATHAVALGCNMPALSICSDVTGLMTQSQDSGARSLCTGVYGGTIVGTCSTNSRLGTCTYTQGGITFKDRYYTGSGATAADCTGTGEAN